MNFELFMALFRASRPLLPRIVSWGLRRASDDAALKRCVVEKVEQCVVIRLVSENGENRLNPEFVEDFHRALDIAERYNYSLSAVYKY